jgi:hypothetical protein
MELDADMLLILTSTPSAILGGDITFFRGSPEHAGSCRGPGASRLTGLKATFSAGVRSIPHVLQRTA